MTGDLAASHAVPVNDDDVDDSRIDGGINSTYGDDGGSRVITCCVGRQFMTTSTTVESTVAPKAPTETTGDLASSPATLGDVDNNVNDV